MTPVGRGKRQGWGDGRRTSGVARVDNAECAWAAMTTRLAQGAPQLGHVECPSALFIQVVVHLHSVELGQRR